MRVLLGAVAADAKGAIAGARLTRAKDGEIVLTARKFRTQEGNRGMS